MLSFQIVLLFVFLCYTDGTVIKSVTECPIHPTIWNIIKSNDQYTVLCDAIWMSLPIEDAWQNSVTQCKGAKLVSMPIWLPIRVHLISRNLIYQSGLEWSIKLDHRNGRGWMEPKWKTGPTTNHYCKMALY